MKCTKKHDARAKLLFFQPFFVVLVAVAVVVALAPLIGTGDGNENAT